MQRFRTATPMGDWRSFKFTMTAAGPWTEGQLYLVENTVGVLLLDIQYTAAGCKKAKTILITEEGVLVYHIEKIIVDKVTTSNTDFLPGDNVFWDAAVQGSPVSPVDGGGTWIKIGICVRAAAWTDDEVMIDLKGDRAEAVE